MGVSEVEARAGASSLQQRSREQHKAYPEFQAQEQGTQHPDVEALAEPALREGRHLIDIGIFACIAVGQLAWFGLLGYGVYSVGQLLP